MSYNCPCDHPSQCNGTCGDAELHAATTKPQPQKDGNPTDENGWRVKPLEWRQGYRDDTCTISQAHAIGGIYQVRVLNGVVWLDKPIPSEQIIYTSVEEAKAAAQADFEAAIFSSIYPFNALLPEPVE